MSQQTIPVLVISGSMGAGKTTVLYEASDILAEVGVSHAAIDLDALSVMFPSQGPHGEHIAFANLAAIWPIYARAGADRLLIAWVIEERSELAPIHGAVPRTLSRPCAG